MGREVALVAEAAAAAVAMAERVRVGAYTARSGSQQTLVAEVVRITVHQAAREVVRFDLQ